MSPYPSKPEEDIDLELSDGSDPLLSSDVPRTLPWQRRERTGVHGLRGCLRSASRSVISILRQALTRRVARVLAFSAIAWFVLFLYSKHRFWRDPESAFFREEGVYELQYSRERQDKALDLVHARNQSSQGEAARQQPSANPVICVGMVTVKRQEKMDYLNGTIGSMLLDLTDEERDAISIQLLFADSEPARHPGWDQPWLDNTVDNWSTYNVSDEQLEEIKEWARTENMQRKGVFDYIYILEQCFNNTDAPYIAVFEDDLIFAEGWLAKAITTLGNIRKETTDWLYLRLFYVDRFYYWPEDPWYTHPTLWMLLAMLVAVGSTLVLRICWHRKRPGSDTSLLVAIGCVTIPLFIFLIFLIGKNSLTPNPAEGFRRMDEKGCCTQALIYPRHMVTKVTALLREKVSGQTDLLLERCADRMQYARYALVPQVVQHIGVVSTRGMPKKFARATWAFFFEASDPKKLHLEHEQLAKWGIWRATHD